MLLFFSSCLETTSVEITTPEVVENSDLDLDDGVMKVLFIGNSHTYFNSLPSIVEELLKDKIDNQTIEISSATGGGLSFTDHVNMLSTIDAIHQDNWDVVVLQENGVYGSFPIEEAQTMVYPHAETLRNRIFANHPETAILLYMTHAFKNGGDWCDEDPNVCSYELMQDAVRQNYLEMEDFMGAAVAPAGMMWWIINDEMPMELWDNDNIHTSHRGAFVSALTIAIAISGTEAMESDFYQNIFEDAEKEVVISSINNCLFNNNPDWRTYE